MIDSTKAWFTITKTIAKSYSKTFCVTKSLKRSTTTHTQTQIHSPSSEKAAKNQCEIATQNAVTTNSLPAPEVAFQSLRLIAFSNRILY